VEFIDKNNPTMEELIFWFQVNFKELADAMKDSDHAVKTTEPNPYHLEGSVWAHTMMVCQEARNDNKIVKLSALLHDVGKPAARGVIPAGEKKPSFNGEERNGPNIETSAKEKVHFRGHDGVSFWKAIDPLSELVAMNVIDECEMNQILKIISLHSVLFNRIKDGKEFKPEEIVKMFPQYEHYKNFVKQSRNDSLGRFYKKGAGSRGDTGPELGSTLYGEETFKKYFKAEFITGRNSTENPYIEILVGLPCSGKTTYINNKKGEFKVISRDDMLMRYAKKYKIEGSYSEIWSQLDDNDQKVIDTYVRDEFRKAVQNRENIVIDMTNMSKKSRGKWINNLPKEYFKVSKIFIVGESSLDFRNNQRLLQEGKFIPEKVFMNMMKTFLVPTLNEFDAIEYINSYKGENK